MKPIERAKARAAAMYPRSKQFQGVYLDGARAALAGRSSAACPYRGQPGDGTWRRSFRLAWMRGHASCAPIEDE